MCGGSVGKLTKGTTRRLSSQNILTSFWPATRSRGTMSLLKMPTGQGIGSPMKTASDDIRLSKRALLRCAQFPCMGCELGCIRATQLRTAATAGTATLVQLRSP